jgi:hypothetical protein
MTKEIWQEVRRKETDFDGDLGINPTAGFRTSVTNRDPLEWDCQTCLQASQRHFTPILLSFISFFVGYHTALSATQTAGGQIIFNPKGNGRVQVQALHLPACSDKPHFVAQNDLYHCQSSSWTLPGREADF